LEKSNFTKNIIDNRISEKSIEMKTLTKRLIHLKSQ